MADDGVGEDRLSLICGQRPATLKQRMVPLIDDWGGIDIVRGYVLISGRQLHQRLFSSSYFLVHLIYGGCMYPSDGLVWA
jgi:hypothetical protein